MLTSKQRAALRSAANTLEPVFLIGKGEIDEAMIAAIESCLANRELIKIKCLETAEYSAKEAAEILAPALNAEGVQIIGRKFVLFRQKAKDSAFDEILNPTLAAKKKATAKKSAAPKATAKTSRWGRPDFARSGEHGRPERPAGRGQGFGQGRSGGQAYGSARGRGNAQGHGTGRNHSGTTGRSGSRFGRGPGFGSGQGRTARFPANFNKKKQG